MDEKILEITHKNRSLSVPDEGYFERHLMKVITETCCAH
jgi:hypothetical protein